MGEAKRRKENDPNYGKVPQKKPKKSKPFKFDIKSISPLEWLVWAVLFGTTAAVVVRGYFLQ